MDSENKKKKHVINETPALERCQTTIVEHSPLLVSEALLREDG